VRTDDKTIGDYLTTSRTL